MEDLGKGEVILEAIIEAPRGISTGVGKKRRKNQSIINICGIIWGRETNI